jgi:hypothetical protein
VARIGLLPTMSFGSIAIRWDGEAPGIAIRWDGEAPGIAVLNGDRDTGLWPLNSDQARELAAVLLAAADEIDGLSDPAGTIR